MLTFRSFFIYSFGIKFINFEVIFSRVVYSFSTSSIFARFFPQSKPGNSCSELKNYCSSLLPGGPSCWVYSTYKTNKHYYILLLCTVKNQYLCFGGWYIFQFWFGISQMAFILAMWQIHVEKLVNWTRAPHVLESFIFKREREIVLEKICWIIFLDKIL